MKTSKMKRQKITPGSILKIDLGNGYHSYARIVTISSFAFYDCKTKTDNSDLNRIISCPILFITTVYSDVITKCIWTIIGELPVEDSLSKLPPRFIQDPIHPEQFRIKSYELNAQTPASFEDCIGMERASVWEAHAIVERLNDYFENRITNKMDFYDRPELFKKAKQVA